jgi:hypothetical protein
MADLKLQASRALKVITSDTIDIPQPSRKVASGTQTSATANKLTDTGATFDDGTITIGDIVYDTTDSSIATVTAIDSGTVLSLSADIFTATENYVIYDKATRDCVIYVGVTGDVSVVTAGGDSEVFTAVPAGMILPVNIRRVNTTLTTATNMVALW